MDASRRDAAAVAALLRERILVIDGAMGTMLQGFGLGEDDYRGDRFRQSGRPLKGDHDLLNLTRPDVVRQVHDAYLAAGADIVETNTFNATAIAQADYGMEAAVPEVNRAGAAIARAACDAAEAADRAAGRPARPRFVAGVLGPTNRTASLSPDVADPGRRDVTFRQLADAYAQAARGLIEGGADWLLIETVFDTLNAKAALFAIDEVLEQAGVRLPVWISGTITDKSGRTLSGQTAEAFWHSVRHARPLAVGFNCALGAEQLRPHVAAVGRIADTFLSAHPNAGLPDEMGQYDQGPETMAALIGAWAREGLVNLVGGCCGTTPDHIRAIRQAVLGVAPRRVPDVPRRTRLSGLEPVTIGPDTLFVNVGERTNVTGSRRFARCVRDGDHDAAVEIARQQVQAGAQVIDVNMDEGLLDSEAAMVAFLRLVAAEPDIARVPVMIDSSRWSVIEAGLQQIQGRGVVNSISLKGGEAEFLRQAALCRRYGAAVVVMAFDEQGQADTVERKVAVCRRAHRLLVEVAGLSPEDIVLDPNVFAIATGIEEHRGYAQAYIEAARRIKAELPGCLVSGGVSNVSFAFRGNDAVREAIHSVFLYHAIAAGMDMGIVNAGQLGLYEDIEPDLRERVEDVVLDRRPDATERLLEVAEAARGVRKDAAADLAWRDAPCADRIRHALVHGIATHIEEDAAEALAALGRPLLVIEGPLMAGMDTVGDLFGAGKMFLPQVVKSARVMKKAVAWLEPALAAERAAGVMGAKGRLVLATVKGDVHDIGKNIVSVVLQCNGYEVVDLGVMVPAEAICDAAQGQGADAVGLSGLITPSLDEMVAVAGEMRRRGMTVPLLIGGATTSKVHTALKIDPAYDGPVVHVPDASRAVGVTARLLSAATGEPPAEAAEYAEIRRLRAGADPGADLLTLEQARANGARIAGPAPRRPRSLGVRPALRVEVADLVRYIDWKPFWKTWGLDPGQPDERLREEADRLLRRIARERLLQPRGALAFFAAARTGPDDIALWTDEARSAGGPPVHVIHALRQQSRRADGRPNRCLADYVATEEQGGDWLGAFAVTAGHGLAELVAGVLADHDDYQAILAKALADRLAEAFAEALHERVRRELWGYAPAEALDAEGLIAERYQGIRPAPGYPACPDHGDTAALLRLLDAEALAGITATESAAMVPAASVAGWYFARPEARYFGVGRIGRDQLLDWARRQGLSEAAAQRRLSTVLAG